MRSIWIFFKQTPAANTFFCPLHQNKLKPIRHWALISSERDVGKNGRPREIGGQGERKAVRDDDQSGKKPDGGHLGAVQDLMSLWSACLDSKHPNGTTTDRKKNTTTDLPLRLKRKTKFMLFLDRLINIKMRKYTHGLQTHLKYCLYVPPWGDV